MSQVENSPLRRFNNYDRQFWHKKIDNTAALGLIAYAAITLLTGSQAAEISGIVAGTTGVSSPITFPLARASVAQARWMFRRNNSQTPQPQA